ncbi:hypothetical protein FB567DRAFT_520494 [Paraphoma chrysanthemicola]|uniref:Uncharacterized protein n=1 Tax=Paraphoma chrysanthemicola TaxID=798071 RepID=A0A8K0RDN2_9PLEO|nr:hypothetical protein FB567DRAFT_520494 [Paraphoma chrysanthemicola]
MSHRGTSCGGSQSGRLPRSTDYGGLPADEYQTLRRANDRERLERHFKSGSRSRALQPSRSAYRDAGLSYTQRHDISEVRNATRAALGASFDFTDDTYGRSTRHRDEYERSRGWTDDKPSPSDAIPQRYLKEHNQRWHEDDEDNDADRYLDDHNRNAIWRSPARLTEIPLFREPAHNSRPRSAVPSSRADSGYYSNYEQPSPCARDYDSTSDQQTPISTWSDDEDSYKKPSRTRRFMSHVRRH